MLRLLCASLAAIFLSGWAWLIYAVLGPWALAAGAALIVATIPAQLAWMRHKGRL